jgi:secreted PhoX family phosphatase
MPAIAPPTQAQQWGMHNDGVIYFPITGSTHGLLVQNNEYTDDGLLFPDGVANWNEEKTNKSINAHGIAIIEIIYQGGEWRGSAPVKIRAADHGPDANCDRRASGRRRPFKNERGSDRQYCARHGE